jgi:hypothetical protein
MDALKWIFLILGAWLVWRLVANVNAAGSYSVGNGVGFGGAPYRGPLYSGSGVVDSAPPWQWASGDLGYQKGGFGFGVRFAPPYIPGASY